MLYAWIRVHSEIESDRKIKKQKVLKIVRPRKILCLSVNLGFLGRE